MKRVILIIGAAALAAAGLAWAAIPGSDGTIPKLLPEEQRQSTRDRPIDRQLPFE